MNIRIPPVNQQLLRRAQHFAEHCQENKRAEQVGDSVYLQGNSGERGFLDSDNELTRLRYQPDQGVMIRESDPKTGSTIETTILLPGNPNAPEEAALVDFYFHGKNTMVQQTFHLPLEGPAELQTEKAHGYGQGNNVRIPRLNEGTAEAIRSYRDHYQEDFRNHQGPGNRSHSNTIVLDGPTGLSGLVDRNSEVHGIYSDAQGNFKVTEQSRQGNGKLETTRYESEGRTNLYFINDHITLEKDLPQGGIQERRIQVHDEGDHLSTSSQGQPPQEDWNVRL